MMHLDETEMNANCTIAVKALSTRTAKQADAWTLQ